MSGLRSYRSNPKKGNIPLELSEGHYRLRGPRKKEAWKNKGKCPGSNDSWKIIPDLALGHEQNTHVVELQLCDLDGVWLKNETVARTLAVALRDALADFIGIQANEIGCTSKSVRYQGIRCQSIMLYDRFAAGYVSQTGKNLECLLRTAREKLICSADCDSACPQCVLDFDQRFDMERLNRKKALEFLTPTWLDQLRLPEQWDFFGEARSRAEIATSLEEALLGICREQPDVKHIYLFAMTDEETDIANSSLRQLAYRLAGMNVSVTLIFAAPVDPLREEDRYLLAAMADHPKIHIAQSMRLQRVGEGFLLAEVAHGNGFSAWAADSKDALLADESWAVASPLIAAEQQASAIPKITLQSASELRPAYRNRGDKEITIHHEWNGSLQQFGQRFWNTIIEQHPATGALLNGADTITAVHYQDRYLLNPLAVALLYRVCQALKAQYDEVSWSNVPLRLVTTSDKHDYRGNASYQIWHDWRDLEQRDAVIQRAWKRIGMLAETENRSRRDAPHNRTLTLHFTSGTCLRIRLDQGFSYWKTGRVRENRRFPFHESISKQVQALCSSRVTITGGDFPTQLFCACREKDAEF